MDVKGSHQELPANHPKAHHCSEDHLFASVGSMPEMLHHACFQDLLMHGFA